MSNVWYAAIQDIYANCWFTSPGYVSSVNDSVGTGPVDVSISGRPCRFENVTNTGNSRQPVKRSLAGT